MPPALQLSVSVVITFVIGYAAIAWLLRFLAHHAMYWFVGYRVVLALVVMALLATGVVAAGMTVILLRHGRSTSNTAHTLAGRTEGVELDDKGRAQADALVERVDGLPIKALVRSPLLRCRLTLEPLAAALGLQPLVDERLAEVDYGQWTGRATQATW